MPLLAELLQPQSSEALSSLGTRQAHAVTSAAKEVTRRVKAPEEHSAFIKHCKKLLEGYDLRRREIISLKKTLRGFLAYVHATQGGHPQPTSHSNLSDSSRGPLSVFGTVLSDADSRPTDFEQLVLRSGITFDEVDNAIGYPLPHRHLGLRQSIINHIGELEEEYRNIPSSAPPKRSRKYLQGLNSVRSQERGKHVGSKHHPMLQESGTRTKKLKRNRK